MYAPPPTTHRDTSKIQHTIVGWLRGKRGCFYCMKKCAGPQIYKPYLPKAPMWASMKGTKGEAALAKGALVRSNTMNA